MGSLYRSEEMCKAQVFLQSEAAYACVAELGELGLVQFRDLNPDVNAFQRKFVNEVRRCDEMERKLRFLEKEILRADIRILDTGENPEAPAPREMIDLESCFEKLENEIQEINTNQEALKRNYLELTELKHILEKAQQFFEEIRDVDKDEESHTMLGEEGLRPGQAMSFGFVAGVIQRERIPAFEQMLWRVCRGNVFLRLAEIDTALEDPSTGDEMQKSVFIIFFQGDQLKTRVKKICEGFRATLYPCPESQGERKEMALGVNTRIEDLQAVLSQTDEHRQRVLSSAANNLRVWFIKVRKLKAIYHTLNLFNLDVTQKCLIAECWCPVSDLEQIQIALRRGTERSGSSVSSILNRMETIEPPPTYNRTNKFTEVFQEIVDAFGIANYREVNPAPFTIITFPFLFAVMFGDAGHGLIMTLFALWLILREKQLANTLAKNEMVGPLYSGRYIIFLMGLFSIYSGILYNDCFSKSINIFGSSWKVGSMINKTDLSQPGSFILNPADSFAGSPYPIGVDPIWQVSNNKLNVLNSLKMKLSVTLGISQMVFGVILSYVNYRFFRQRMDVYLVFIPQLIFIMFIFGYLILMIFLKWFLFDDTNSSEAPSLIITLINMFMFTPPLHQLYTGQLVIQHFLVVIAVFCVPFLLFGKPTYRYLVHTGKLGKAVNYRDVRMLKPGGSDELRGIVDQDELGEGDLEASVEYPEDRSTEGHSNEEEFDLFEEMIHQSIETIEYCLSLISHTASYLRLWALSLAHAELSDVLWGMILADTAFTINGFFGGIMIFITFSVWACLTVFILLMMEGLSAFLHTLRLHWVEFQSKFYSGGGYIFAPFSFATILDIRDELHHD
ncbi:V-type proton ATPase 116 kDa subunit a 1-like isoform X2 [Apostichopus japonicus]|uniref:V-type proton ATPase 116 kDa subunit a 1-like isoform X2 n=1 Tax=Stichopus japonicus TaxID=307972 RepID=UPI003AB1358E